MSENSNTRLSNCIRSIYELLFSTIMNYDYSFFSFHNNDINIYLKKINK